MITKAMKKQSNTGKDSPPVQHFYRRIEELLSRKGCFVLLAAVLIVLKLALMGVFSSDYQNKMFEPFVKDFLGGWQNGFSNPYQSFFERGEEMNFPYPPVMLIIMSVSEAICMAVSSAPLFIHNIIFKLPLLIMDCVVFRKLCRMFPDKRISVTFAYFASPLILYATYMHGQLDIVPMAFLFGSLIFLTRENTEKRFYLSGIFLALALLSKFHIAAILPLIIIYIYKHYGFGKTITYSAVVASVTAIVILPFYGQGFIDGVVFNSAQSSLFSLFFSYGSLKLYVSLAAVVLVYLYAMNLNFINSDLLFGLAGLIFSIFLALCAPMPGWYMWVIIFIVSFIVRSNGYKHSILCYALLQALYLIFFVFFHKAQDCAVDLYCLGRDLSFLKLDHPQLRNILFTFLSATMIYMIYLMHKFCIAGNSLYNFHESAFVIGICGDSGTGKSTLQDDIGRMFSADNFLRIEGDGDHKWERGDRNWENYTHMNPQANYLYRQAMDIRKLKNGEAVKRVDYDHDTGHFTSLKTVRPCRFMSISGLHIFYLPQLRNIVDLKIYTEADEDLRILWKTERDSEKRGHTKEEVYKQIQSRYEDVKKYIYPQKEFADIIIHYFLDNEEKRAVGMKIKISTTVDMEGVIMALRDAGAELSYEFSDDFRYQIVIYHPSENEKDIDFAKLFSEVFEHGYDILSKPFTAGDTADGIRKLVLIQAIISKLREDV